MLVWTSVSKRCIDLPDRFYERVCESLGPELVDLLKPRANRYKVAILRPPYRYHFATCSNELERLVPLPFLHVWCTKYASWLLCDCNIL